MSRDHVDVRATAPDELRAASDAMRIALLSAPTSDDDWEKVAASWAEPEHDSLTAWDAGRCVAHVGGFRFDTVVPGGAQLATSGVTRIGVLPTYTRQGLLTRMLTKLLVDARARAMPLASLRASEGVIYRRFGFGIAGNLTSVEVDAARVRPVRGGAPGSQRLLARDEALDVVPALYERIARRPGAIIRPAWMWKRYLGELIDGSEAQHVVVHTSPEGVDDGFAHYSLKWKEAFETQPYGIGEIWDLWGETPAVELALWRFLTEIDLVRIYTAEERPLDDVLRMAATDPRAYRTVLVSDEQWLRLLDVDTALRARTYRASDPVTIAVTDPLFDDNNGVWRVGADGVERTTGDADVVADITALSASYLGATSWYQLIAAGDATARDDDAVARADALFVHRPTAFCGSHF
jgi:predicted acetyltransferase